MTATPDEIAASASAPREKPAPFPVRPIRMPADLWNRAVAEGEQQGLTGSAVVRVALEAYLADRERATA